MYELRCLPSKATVNVDPNSNGTYTLTPTVGKRGQDVFTYTVTQMRWDGSPPKLVTVEGTTPETNQVSLTILPVNQPPEATTTSTFAVRVSETLTAVKLMPATGRDVDGHLVTYRLVSKPTLGTFSFVATSSNVSTGDPSFVYTAGAVTGTETIRYTVDDCSENTDLVALEDQVAGAAWNRLNCMSGATEGSITIQITATNSLPAVKQGSMTLVEDQSPYPQGTFYRDPNPDIPSDPYLRFVMRETPRLGQVDFLCGHAYGFTNWTTMGAGQYCETVGGTNGTESQIYRFRPTVNAHGSDTFTVGLSAIAQYANKIPAAATIFPVTIAPTNDAPSISDNRSVTVVGYNYRVNESAWLDPLNPNATAPVNFTAVSFNVTSVDAEPTMQFNMSYPERGDFYVSLTADGSSVNVSTKYVVGSLMNMQRVGATNSTTSFTMTLYYVPPKGFRGSPIATVNWWAWDGTMTRSITAKALLQVLCPVGYEKERGKPNPIITHSLCSRCPAGTYAPVEDSSGCTNAAPGYFAKGGTPRQEPCRIGTYSDLEGAKNCKTCPANREGGDTNLTSTTLGTASSSITDCVCTMAMPKETYPFGYYGRPGEACYYCENDKGWTCTENNLTFPMPKFGYWIDVCRPYPAKERECFPASACEAIVSANVSTMFRTNSNVSSAVACAKLPVPDVVDGTCKSGYELDACSSCTRPGYYRLEGGCRKCPKTSGSEGTIALLAIGIIIAAPILFKLSEQMKNFPSINMGISFSQYIGLFASQLEYPEVLRRFMSAFSIFNFNMELIHPECTMTDWNYSKKWMVMSLMPIFVFASLALAVAVAGVFAAYRHFVGKNIMKLNPNFLKLGEGQRAGMVYKVKRMLVTGINWNSFVSIARKAIRAQLTFFQVAFVFLASSSFEIFDCTKNESDGLYYLDSEPSVRCGWPHAPNDTASQSWLDIYQIALFTMFFYVIGIFLLFAVLLFMVRDSLDEETPREILGFFYFRYEKKWFAYELVQLFKKAALAGILSLMVDGNTSLIARKTSCSIMVVTLITLMHFYAAPYESSNLDNMMSMMLATEFMLLFSGLVFLTDKLSSTFRTALQIINIIVIIASVCAMTVFIVVDIMPGKLSQLKKYFATRKERKVKAEKKKKLAKEKKARKARGEEEKMKPLSIFAQVKLFNFVKRTMVSAQAAIFFNPRTTHAMATLRTAWGHKKIRLATEKGELSKVNITKDDVKGMMNRLQKHLKKKQTLNIMKKPDPKFGDFLKGSTKSDTLEGMAMEDIAENHRADHFFEKLMCNQHPLQQNQAKKRSLLMMIWQLTQGRSMWKRQEHGLQKLRRLEAEGKLTLSKKLEESDISFHGIDSERDQSHYEAGAASEASAVQTISAEENEGNDSAGERKNRTTLQRPLPGQTLPRVSQSSSLPNSSTSTAEP